MIEKIESTFRCEHCRKLMTRKHSMIRHEIVCAKNPDNFIKCSGCSNLVETTKDYEVGYSDYSYNRSSKSFHCKKYDKGLYPPKAKHLVEQYPETFEDEELMPKECDGYEFSLPF